ncbi:MAG: ribonuclease E/G [Rhizomicrobium sp.]
MLKRMLIDANHPEETRVVVLDGQKVEEFDFEAASKRPLKGNIYLAKVTRVEPSLQAAFVEYGGNRQGFLAFSEIHPDYYQIPVADRLALLAEQEAEARRRSDEDVESFEIAPGPKPQAQGDFVDAALPEELASEESINGDFEDEVSPAETRIDRFKNVHVADTVSSPENLPIEDDDRDEDLSADVQEDLPVEQDHIEGMTETLAAESGPIDLFEDGNSVQSGQEHTVEDGHSNTGQHPAKPLNAQRAPQRWMRKRHYKIQEVIKRRQIILVQVVKEERGNKGAALTTYLSLAGRYCVLMPNTPRGGGISRKITNANDRKRLKSAAQALELPEGMGLIIRTAGENRTKVEIKRDYEYLLRMWDTIRETTLKSNAPACVYEEGDLIKRAIRDLYNKDVAEVLVEGDEGYRNAKDFMRLLMPSHAKNVRPYKEPTPLFQRHHIEAQLEAMFSPTVTLKSGGYIVINQTEALVSIDVNSGRATREHSIEDTARKTNLEAADEIGRQLRLRDLAGLIVIDFIDMEDGRNDRDVEKRIRDAVKNDRARVQIGKISQFGLLEMSRQRLRAGVIAGSTVPCPHCGGQGIVRSVESTALRLLRGLEEEGQKLKSSAVAAFVALDVAIYTLNQKRRELDRIENEYGMVITFEPKDDLIAGTFEIESTAQMSAEQRAKFVAIQTDVVAAPVEEEPEDIEEAVEDEPLSGEMEDAGQPAISQHKSPIAQENGAPSKRRRRRRGGRGRNGGDRQGSQLHVQSEPQHSSTPATLIGETTGDEMAGSGEPEDQFSPSTPMSSDPAPNLAGAPRKRRRRRGKRGGGNGQQQAGSLSPAADQHDRFGTPDEIDTTPREEPRYDADRSSIAAPNAASSPVWSLTHEERDTVAPQLATHEASISSLTSKAVDESKADAQAAEESAQPAKKGWWQRAFRSDS